MTHIPAQWTTDGFMQRFEENLKKFDTYLGAYHETEQEHLQLFGTERYKSYDAFRMTRKQILIKKTSK